MKKLLLTAAAFSLIGFAAPLQSAMAQSAAGPGDIQLQGSQQPSPGTPLYNLQKGDVTADSKSASPKVEAYPTDGSQSQKAEARDAMANPSDADEHHDRDRDEQSKFPQ